MDETELTISPMSDDISQTTMDVETNTLENVADMESIKQQFDELTRSDGIDKQSALVITQLQHKMETLFINMLHSKEKKIERLTFELNNISIKQENERLSRVSQDFKQENIDLTERLKRDTDEFTAQLNQHVGTINRLQQEAMMKKKR